MTREEAIEKLELMRQKVDEETYRALILAIKALEQEPKSGKCKNCKYFEYDSVARVERIPIIVAHEICNKWGGGCKTKEDGYCYLFEPQESEDKE